MNEYRKYDCQYQYNKGFNIDTDTKFIIIENDHISTTDHK